MNEFPEIMANAKVDLAATVEGKFGPEDWKRIFDHAFVEWQSARRTGAGELEAWQDVVRDFHRQQYWGFKPNYKAKRRPNFGLQLIWILFNSLCTIKVAILWFGQLYSNNDDPKYKWIFFLTLFVIAANFVFFLWRNRAYED